MKPRQDDIVRRGPDRSGGCRGRLTSTGAWLAREAAESGFEVLLEVYEPAGESTRAGIVVRGFPDRVLVQLGLELRVDDQGHPVTSDEIVNVRPLRLQLG